MIAFDNKRNQHYGPEKTHIKKNMEKNKENQEAPASDEKVENEALPEEEGFELEDLGVDVPDVPLPSMEEDEDVVEDKFNGAYRFAIVGIGQGGSRIAETFWKMGYRRVAVMNTAIQDLRPIKIPQENKLLLGGGGAGKNPAVAEKIFEDHREDVLDFFKKLFKGGFDRILICAGAGGGTGAGGTSVVIDIAHDLCETMGIEGDGMDTKVGAIVALPTRAEGSRVRTNSVETAKKLVNNIQAGTLSPLIILDNERIKQLYSKLSINKFWSTANSSICSLFHLFNRIAAQNSEYTAFDKADLDTVLASGIITFGATPVPFSEETGIDETDISHAIRDNLKKNILAVIEVSTGSVAACVAIGDKKTLDNTPQESLEHGFEQLSRLLGEGSVVHRGIYHTGKPGLVVYTIIGGIDPPKDFVDPEETLPKDQEIKKTE